MRIELHMLQNFAPSCLNRDDTNAPKDCEFGGYRRARISSQCIKRAIRRSFQAEHLLPDANLAHRTKRLVDTVTERLVAAGKDPTEARAIVTTAIRAGGLGVKEDGKTEYLLFLGDAEVAAYAKLIEKHWTALRKATAATGTGTEKKGAKDKKKDASGEVPTELTTAFTDLLDGGKAVDLALFGRMLADLPDRNVEAACQVAHAISTHKVSMEMDFYTAVDDLKPDDTSGADMMGTIAFNSSCFYRYANLDVHQLKENLKGDATLATKAVEAFLHAAITAIPTGKQSTMAAQNPPSLVLAVVRETGGPWSLANAFVHPVRPTSDKSVVQTSIEALDQYWGKLVGVYGATGIKGSPLCLLDDVHTPNLDPGKIGSIESLIATVMKELRP